jgi:hypothetical protein
MKGVAMSRKEPNSKRNWHEDYNLENGKYYNFCAICSNEFLGHKRRVICRQCFIEGKEVEEKDPMDADSCVTCCQAVIKELIKAQKEVTAETRRAAKQVYSARYRLTNYPESAADCIQKTAYLCGGYKINLVIIVEPSSLVWAYAVADIPAIVECECHCHKYGGIHFTACCEGQCKDCGKGFHSGLGQHIQACCPLFIKDVFIPPVIAGCTIGALPESMLKIEFGGDKPEVKVTSEPIPGFSSEPNRGGDEFKQIERQYCEACKKEKYDGGSGLDYCNCP